ncbi:MAG: hypothetical protein AAFR61_31985 [Bacteroidota bacterium]
MKQLSYILTFSLFLGSCAAPNSAEERQAESPVQFTAERTPFSGEFNQYWYAGKAELNSYELEQARYGEIHRGHAVLIFVTEDFSASKQVKLDYPGGAGEDKVPIMKLNFTKKFNTGIYPYSLMSSVFTPVDLKQNPHTLKTSMSGQEWCGHVFQQLNLRKDHYQSRGYSYFESEGDLEEKLPKVLLEDELWTRIRLQPSDLPQGEVKLVPGSFYTRLRHKPSDPQSAELSLTEADGIATYTIKYPDSGRSLSIQFQASFPHQILGWEETLRSGYGASARPLTTKARLKKSLRAPYWSQNNVADLPLREALGLPQ